MPTPTPSPVYIQMVGEGAFWDSPFFIALLTLGGVVVGAGLSFLFNWIQEKRKAERVLQERFYDQVLEYSSDVVRAAEVINDHATDVNGVMGLPPSTQARQSVQNHTEWAWQQMAEHIGNMRRASAMLKLVAPKPIREAAQVLMTSTATVLNAQHDLTRLRKDINVMRAANSAFQEAVRMQFNVSA